MAQKNKVVSGLIWNYVERFSKEGVSLLISIVLANLLLPEQFGAIALLNVFISLSNVLIVTGFNTALIQKKEIDKTDSSSVFYCSFAISILMYLILFASAPFIATYYKMPELCNVLRVISVVLPIGSYNSIQVALVTRELKFKLIFISSIIAVVFSGTAGVVAAYLGLGIWALAVQTISSTLVSCIVLRIAYNWKPAMAFSISKLKVLISFGWKIAVSSLVDTLYNDVFSLVIGKKYSASDLAFYNRGQQFPHLLSKNVTSSISTVMLPVYSQLQDDKAAVKVAVRKSISVCSFVMFPLIFGLLACSKPLIMLLYSPKWAESIPYMELFCIAFLFYPINMANTQALNGMGRSDIFLRINIIKKCLGLIALIISVPFGVKAIAIGYAATAFLNLIINIFPNKKLLNYGIIEQVKDIFSSLVLGAAMCVVCLLLVNFINNNLLLLISQILVGAMFYIGLAFLFKIKPAIFLLKNIKEFIKKEKTNNKV